MSLPDQHSRLIKDLALRHGFMGAGISRAEFMEEESIRLEAWLNKGYQGEMAYMNNHFDMRVDPRKLVPGARSVISLLYNYFPAGEAEAKAEGNSSKPFSTTLNQSKQHLNASTFQRLNKEAEAKAPTSAHLSERLDEKPASELRWAEKAKAPTSAQLSTKLNETPDSELRWAEEAKAEGVKIARYAYGEDYHKVVRRKLKALVREMKEAIGDFHARVFVDSAPVMERDWAKRSGLGWIGRNTLLIQPQKGSYFFLAEIILDVELAYDHPMRDHCGTCTRCIDACPTDAISPEGYVLDGSKCISYLTIELRNEIPAEFKGKMEGWIFGCDICQEVCPWNRFSTPHQEPAFEPVPPVSAWEQHQWQELTEDLFDQYFNHTPLKRAGHTGLRRNVRFVVGEKSNK